MLYEITDETFEAQVLQSPVPCVIEFTAGWCDLCDRLLPVLEELSGEFAGEVKFCTANTDTQRKLRIKFAVAALPYIVMVRDGRRIPLFDSLVTAERLSERIRYVLDGGEALSFEQKW